MILTGDTEILGDKHYGVSVVDEVMCQLNMCPCVNIKQHSALRYVTSPYNTLLFNLIFTSGNVFC
jgi:hypothetical protein